MALTAIHKLSFRPAGILVAKLTALLIRRNRRVSPIFPTSQSIRRRSSYLLCSRVATSMIRLMAARASNITASGPTDYAATDAHATWECSDLGLTQ